MTTRRNKWWTDFWGSWIWLLLALATLVLRATVSESHVETYYSRGLFLLIRQAFDLVTAWMPMALLYLVPGLLVGWWIWRWKSRPTRYEGWARVGATLIRLLGFMAAVVTLFMWLWGFNYARRPVSSELGLHPVAFPLDTLVAIARRESVQLALLRSQIPGADTSALTGAHFRPDLERYLSDRLETTLAAYKFPVPGRVRARLLYPRGIFLRFGSSGLYFPFTGEGHVDAGLNHLQRPAVMAHELAHGYGFADEGECSFWAYVACFGATDPAVAYAGRLSYWRALAATYKRHRPEEYQAYRAELPAGIQADLDAINANLLAYPDFVPRLRYAAYDAYLKAQGIPEGMLNYGTVVQLVEAWRQQQ